MKKVILTLLLFVTVLPVIVKSQSTDTATQLNGFAADRWASSGDYFGLEAKADGSFQVLWSDSRTGVCQLYTSNIIVR